MAQNTTGSPRKREPRLPWTVKDEKTVMREDLDAETAAELTGHSLTAVIGRRQLLTYLHPPTYPTAAIAPQKLAEDPAG